MLESFDFKKFVKRLDNKDYYDVIYLADQEALKSERYYFKNRSHASGACLEKTREYACLIKSFIKFIRYGVKTRNVCDEEFKLFQIIRENVYPPQKTAYSNGSNGA